MPLYSTDLLSSPGYFEKMVLTLSLFSYFRGSIVSDAPIVSWIN